MNIYELERKATPISVNGRVDWDSWAEHKLATHCRNNFMRALEALKACLPVVEAYVGNRCAGEAEHLAVVLPKLIAELEDVK